MPRRSRFRLLAPLLSLGVALALGGCVVAPGGYYYPGYSYPYAYGYPPAATVNFGWGGGGWDRGWHDGGGWHGHGGGGWHH